MVELRAMTPIQQREWCKHASTQDFRMTLIKLGAHVSLVEKHIKTLQEEKRRVNALIKRCETERRKNDTQML